MDFYASKLCSALESLLENIHSRILDVQYIQWPQNEYEQVLRVQGLEIYLNNKLCTSAVFYT